MNQPGVYTRLLDKISIVKLNSLDLIQFFSNANAAKMTFNVNQQLLIF